MVVAVLYGAGVGWLAFVCEAKQSRQRSNSRKLCRLRMARTRRCVYTVVVRASLAASTDHTGGLARAALGTGTARS